MTDWTGNYTSPQIIQPWHKTEFKKYNDKTKNKNKQTTTTTTPVKQEKGREGHVGAKQIIV